jgi:hypothetical protein
MTYDEQPDRVSSDDINVRIYGKRVKNILADRAAAQTKTHKDKSQ